MKLLLETIHSGVFSPVDFDYIFRSLSQREYDGLSRDDRDIRMSLVDIHIRETSPFWVALHFENISLASYFLKIQFMTLKDYYNALNLVHLVKRRLLEHSWNMAAIQFLKRMASPPSLYRLAFATVSDLIGPRPGRRARVNQLELPFPLGDALLFQSASQLMEKRTLLSSTEEVNERGGILELLNYIRDNDESYENDFDDDDDDDVYDDDDDDSDEDD